MNATYYDTINNRIVGENTAGSQINYLTNPVGSVTTCVRGTGDVVNTSYFKPYGNILDSQGPGLKPSMTFCGALGYRAVTRQSITHDVRHHSYDASTSSWT